MAPPLISDCKFYSAHCANTLAQRTIPLGLIRLLLKN